MRIRHSEYVKDTKQLKWQIRAALRGNDAWNCGEAINEEESPKKVKNMVRFS